MARVKGIIAGEVAEVREGKGNRADGSEFRYHQLRIHSAEAAEYVDVRVYDDFEGVLPAAGEKVGLLCRIDSWRGTKPGSTSHGLNLTGERYSTVVA